GAEVDLAGHAGDASAGTLAGEAGAQAVVRSGALAAGEDAEVGLVGGGHPGPEGEGELDPLLAVAGDGDGLVDPGLAILEDGGGDVEVVGAGEGAFAALTDDDVAEVEAGGVADELALLGAADEANSLFRLALVGGEDDEGLEIVLGGGLHGHLEEAAVPRAEFEGAGGEGEGSRDTPDVLNLHAEGGVAGVDDVDLGRE